MHSSRMRTARASTVCRSLLLGGVYLVPEGGVPGPGGVPAWSWGGVPPWSQGRRYLVGYPPCGQNDTRL